MEDKDKESWEIIAEWDAEWDMEADIIYSPASYNGIEYVCEENRTTRKARLYRIPPTPNTKHVV